MELKHSIKQSEKQTNTFKPFTAVVTQKMKELFLV
jgi:hypothetical protein